MGLFDAFKKKKEIEQIKFEDLETWLDKYVERQELGTKIGILKREIHSKITRTKELLEELEKATLKDESVVPERAKSIMEGNRKAYIQKTKAFLEEIQIPDKYEKIKSFLEYMSERIEELSKDTQKNFFVLREFMEHEARNVAGKIKELDKAISTARETFDRTSLEEIEKIKFLLEEYHDTNNEIHELRKRRQLLEEEKLQEFEKRGKIELKISKLKKSKGFEEYSALKEKEKKILEQHKAAEQKIYETFSGIESAIKKHVKHSGDELLKKYHKNSIQMLIEDESLEVIKKLSGLLKNIKNLELKDSKEERLRKDIQKITDSYLKDMRKKLINAKQEAEDIEKRIKNHTAALNVKEQAGWIEVIDKNLEAIDKRTEEIENSLERLSPSLVKQKIGKLLKELDSNTELR